MKNIIKQSDFIKRYKLLESTGGGHDYSNKTGFSQSLLGRVINRGYSLARMKAHNRTLNVLMNKLDEVYMNAVIKALEQMGVTKEEVTISDEEKKNIIDTLDKILMECDEPIIYVSDINDAPKKLNVKLQNGNIENFDVEWDENSKVEVTNESMDLVPVTKDVKATGDQTKDVKATGDQTKDVKATGDQTKGVAKVVQTRYDGEIIVPEGYSKADGFQEPTLVVKPTDQQTDQQTEPKTDKQTDKQIDQPKTQSIELITIDNFNFKKALDFINQLYNYAESNAKTLNKGQIDFIIDNLNNVTVPPGSDTLTTKIDELINYLRHLKDLKDKKNESFIYESTLDKPKIKKDKTKENKIKKSFDKKLSSYYKTETDLGDMKVSNFNPHDYLDKLKNQGKLKDFIEIVINNVNREQLKEIQLSAEILYGKDEERAKAEFPRNFVTQEPERLKLENKWKRNITQVKSKYLPFYSLSGYFPSDLDPVLSSKEQKLRKGDGPDKPHRPEHVSEANNLSEGQLKLMGLKSDSSGDAVFLRVTVKDTLQQGKIKEFGLITRRIGDKKFLVQSIFHFSEEINLKINKGEDVTSDISKNVFDFNKEPSSAHDIYNLYKLFIKPTNSSDKTEKIVINEQRRFIFVTYENNEYYLWLKESGQRIDVNPFKFENNINIDKDYIENGKPRTWQFEINQKNGIEDKHRKNWSYDNNKTFSGNISILEQIVTFCQKVIPKK